MKKISIVALLCVLVFPAFAEQEKNLDATEDMVASELSDVSEKSRHRFFDGVQFGVGVSGASGLNGFVGYANKDFESFWAKRFGVRFDFATTKPIKSAINNTINGFIGDEIEIGDNLKLSDLDVDAHHFAALVDFYPFGDTWFFGGWRLTGGYYIGELQAAADIAGTINALDAGVYEFELMGHQFKYMGNSVHGTATLDWDYRGPYLGTGVDIGLFAGLKVYVDAGIVFTNKSAQLGLDLPFENLYMDGVPVDNQTIKDIVKEVVDDTLVDAQSELDDYKFYPMVKLGFMYRF